MVDRGSCTFVKKARNAQDSGAAAILIADNTCQCKNLDVCTLDEGTTCKGYGAFMSDDGSGTDITIAAMLMFKQDADPIKDALKKGTTVRVKMSWPVPNPNDHVELDLWTRLPDADSTDFQIMWMGVQRRFGGTVAFTPHYYIYNGIQAKCRTTYGKKICDSLCTNEGRYCAVDPDEGLDHGISGVNIVEESLRRLCIWDIYENDGTGPEFFQYVRGFRVCDNELNFNNTKCINDAMDRANIVEQKVTKCIEINGGTEMDEQNEKLQIQVEEVEEIDVGIIAMPFAYVNGARIRGVLNFGAVFKAVCAGYKHGTQPDVCGKCAECTGSEYSCVLKYQCPLKNADETTRLPGNHPLFDFYIFCSVGTILFMILLSTNFLKYV